MRIEPESGPSKPFASFSSTDFPQPAGPSRISVCPRSTEKEMFCSTGFTSNLIDTSLNSTTGVMSSDGSITAALVPGITSLIGRSTTEDADHGTGDKQVDDDDEHRRHNHRLRSRSAHTLRAARGLHSEVATHSGDDESGEQRLGQALHDVSID